MIWLLSASLVIVGMVLFGIGYKQNASLPASLKPHLLREEVVGVAFIIVGFWTLAVYAVMQIA
jgi:hypothetical protein